MVDRQLSVGAVVAGSLWGIAFAVWLTSYLMDDPGLGNLAILVMGAGATATVRTYFVAQNQRIKAGMMASQASRPVRQIR